MGTNEKKSGITATVNESGEVDLAANIEIESTKSALMEAVKSAAAKESAPALAATFRTDARGIRGFLSYLFDDGEKWAGSEYAGQYEPLFMDVSALMGFMGSYRFQQDPATDIKAALYQELADIQKVLQEIDADEKKREYPPEVLKTDRDNLLLVQAVLLRFEKFFTTPDFLQFEKLPKATQKQLYLLALDDDARKDFTDRITLDVLTRHYESREPSDTERERWDREETKSALRLCIISRLTVSDIIGIYEYLTGTGYTPKEAGKEALEAYKQATRRTRQPADLSQLASAAADLNRGGRPYVPMNTSTALDIIGRYNSTTRPPEVLKTRNRASAKISYGIRDSGQMEIIIDEYEQRPEGKEAFTLDLKSSTSKLLRLLQMALTESNDYGAAENITNRAEISLKTYCEIVSGKSDKDTRKNARKKVLRDLATLHNTHFQYINEQEGTDYFHFIGGADENRRINWGIDRGTIRFYFDPELAKALVKAPQASLPLALFRLSDNNKNAFPLGVALAQHRGIDANVIKGTANIISIAAALESCPDIPKFDEVAKTDRHYGRRIMEPLEKALDILQAGGVLEVWEFCKSKGAPLSESEINNTITTRAHAEKTYIKYELQRYPAQEQLERIGRKQERVEAQTQARRGKKKPAAPTVPDSIKNKKRG